MKKIRILDVFIILLAILCIISIINATKASTEETQTGAASQNESNTTNAEESSTQEYEVVFDTTGELGDVNGSGAVDSSDASDILGYVSERLVKYSIPTPEELAVADVDKDGMITSMDAAVIRVYSADFGAGKEDASLESAVKQIYGE